MRNILIVEDESSMRKKYREVLRPEGFKVFQARDAVEVANMLMRESSTLDLIILDINIKELDGRDIFDIIDQYNPSLPILVSSVHPLQDQRLKIPRATDWHNKSDGDTIFLKKVKKILGLN